MKLGKRDLDVTSSSSAQVTSPGGNETRSARLSVIELPFAPSNAKAERLDTQTQRAINVSWTAGFDGNSPILKFIVQRREVPELGTFFAILSSFSFTVIFISFSQQNTQLYCFLFILRAQNTRRTKNTQIKTKFSDKF